MTEQGKSVANWARLSNDPAWADAMRKGAACLSMGQPDKAAAYFQNASELQPANARAQRQLGAAFLKAGDPVRAAQVFDKACQARPTDPGSLHGLGLALHALGIRGAALDAFRRSAAAGGGWRAWQSIADITENETERLQAIGHAADSLGGFCETSKADASHFAQYMNALLSAHRTHAAKHFARENLCRFPDRSAGYNALARAHYFAGTYRQAFFYKSRALLSLTNCKNENRQGPPPFEPSRAASAFHALSKTLDKAGICHFLVGGTLLGVRRSGEPLAHDRDLDIGILRRPDNSPDMAAFLRHHPDIVFPRISRPGDRYFGVHFMGVGVDFFVYDERDEAMVCGLSNVPGDIQWRFSRFGICWKSYGASHWPVPSDPDLYLSETYGAGWQTPDKTFSSAVSSPALHQTAPYARAYYAAARAGSALQSGHRERAEALRLQSPISFSLPEPSP